MNSTEGYASEFESASFDDVEGQTSCTHKHENAHLAQQGTRLQMKGTFHQFCSG